MLFMHAICAGSCFGFHALVHTLHNITFDCLLANYHSLENDLTAEVVDDMLS